MRRRAPCAPGCGPSGRSLALGVCPWRASHAGIRGYGPRRPLEARVISARSRPRLHGLKHRSHRALPLLRYDSGMTSPFSQLCFRSIVHDIAAAMSRRPVCYHTFAKSLRFTRHHTQLPFEMKFSRGACDAVIRARDTAHSGERGPRARRAGEESRNKK